MKTEQEIKEKFYLLVERRLKERYKLKLVKNYHNCNFACCYNRFYVCANKANLKKDSYLICDDNVCAKCDLYECKYTRLSIEKEFLREIKNPEICFQKEPKIAMLYWILQDCSFAPDSLRAKCISFLKKIKRFIWG